MCRNYEAREENDNRGFANSLTIELSLLHVDDDDDLRHSNYPNVRADFFFLISCWKQFPTIFRMEKKSENRKGNAEICADRDRVGKRGGPGPISEIIQLERCEIFFPIQISFFNDRK